MTSNSNPNKQPTSPGWWWIDIPGYYGHECVSVMETEHGLRAFIGPGAEGYRLSDIAANFGKHTWLGPVLSHDEGQRLQDEVAELREERDGLKDEIELILKHR
jgi:hypothetical protein